MSSGFRSGFAAARAVVRAARPLLPLLSTVLLLCVEVAPWPFVQPAILMPPLALMAVFVWTVYRPDMFGPVSALGIGLLHDALLASVPGVMPLLLLALQQLLLRQRRLFVRGSFFMLWWGYAVTALLVDGVQMVAQIALTPGSGPMGAIAAHWLMGVLIFPLVAAMLMQLQRQLLQDDLPGRG